MVKTSRWIGLLCGHGEVTGVGGEGEDDPRAPAGRTWLSSMPPSGLQGDLASETWLNFIITVMLDK